MKTAISNQQSAINEREKLRFFSWRCLARFCLLDLRKRAWLLERAKLQGALVRGFSLIELLIAMSILAVGIVGAMRTFPVGLKASYRAKMKSQATLAASRAIETLKLKPWSELVDGQTSETVDEFDVTSIVRSIDVQGLTDPTRLKVFEVLVDWTENNRARQISLMTYAVRQDTALTP